MDHWKAYDLMGSHYAEHAADSAYNGHYDRPAVLDCLGDVAAVDVLDAACGPDFYHEELLARGARVQAFDGSEQMVQLVRERTGDQVPIQRVDLDQSLPYAAESFDIVLCALAIHYAADRHATFGEFFRVVRPGGRCCLYPASDSRLAS